MKSSLLLLVLTITLSSVFGSINPSSEQDAPFPGDLRGVESLDALVTPNFGVTLTQSGQSSVLNLFSVGGSSFSFNDNASLVLDGCYSQLLNVADNADSLIVFCINTGNSTYSLIEVNVSSTGLSMGRSQDFELGDDASVSVSGSAFVTKMGNIYIAYSGAGAANSSDGISILEFNVESFTLRTMVSDVADTLARGNSSASYTVQDFHSLPFDSGVFIILNGDDDSQVFAAVFFNGTSTQLDIPAGQTLEAVGRHRGSSFGYTVGSDGGNTPYAVVSSWDLSSTTMTSSVQLKGTVQSKGNGHFSTSTEVFVFTVADDASGYIYELPYSEFGFLPNSVNSAEVPSTVAANLADGVDGTYVYAFTNDNGDVSLSRWTY